MIPKRFDHQEKTYQRLLKTNLLLDTSDPGTGKTRCQLDAYQWHRHSNQGKCALVLAPKTLLYPAWKQDKDKFTPDLKISVATAPNREKGFKPDVDMYITNSDAATWLANQSSSFFERFDTLIMDEITYFKNPFSARSKAMAEIVKYFPRRYGLTGTPNPKDICDLWHLVFLIDDGERLSDSYYGFRHVTCDPLPLHIASQPHLKKWVPKHGIEFQIAQLIADINVRHKFEDCIDIPETHTTHLRYDMNKKAAADYKTLKTNAILSLAEGHVLGLNKAALMNKLFQACSGSVYTNTGDVGVIDSERVDILVDLIKERPHSVVFYQWEHQRDYLLQRLKKEKLSVAVLQGSAKQRETLVKHFQAGFYRVFLAHPQSSGYGLTLTKASSTIWASLTWNLEHFIQGNYRVPRAGQTKRTEKVIITANKTIEEDVYARLMQKNANQDSILNLLEQLS
jgi:SNF2 family DNA or RNA helicase